jgi:hypothetical protein
LTTRTAVIVQMMSEMRPRVSSGEGGASVKVEEMT